MKISRDVVLDLWSVYSSGEASPDTKALVEAFLESDPEWARMLDDRNGQIRLPEVAAPSLPDTELKALGRVKRILQRRDWFLFFAMLFSGLAVARLISDTSFDVSPLQFIVTASLAACLWVAFLIRLAITQSAVFRQPATPRVSSGKRPG